MCLIGHKARYLTSGRASGTQGEGVGIPVDSRIEIYESGVKPETDGNPWATSRRAAQYIGNMETIRRGICQGRCDGRRTNGDGHRARRARSGQYHGD
jgi:hypothetical protein